MSCEYSSFDLSCARCPGRNSEANETIYYVKGRHVATSTVMSVMAIMLTGLDFETKDGNHIAVPDSGPLQLSTVIWRTPRQTAWRGKIRRRRG